MHIGITGGTGLVGKHLTKLLQQQGHQITIFSRSGKGQMSNGIHTARWNPGYGTYDATAFSTLDAAVHLAGAAIAEKRLTEARKAELVRSRVESTRTLIDALRKHSPQCRTLISASATGWYDDDEKRVGPASEDLPPANTFLGKLCRQWEEEAFRASDFLRVVALRIGIVLGKEGGAYPEFTKSLRFGIMPILGSGKQMVSWIHVDDLARMILHAIENNAVQGSFNAVSPNPVSHKALMKTLAKSKAGFSVPMPVPAFALKIALGELSSEILRSLTASADKIQATGFRFRFERIEDAARDLA